MTSNQASLQTTAGPSGVLFTLREASFRYPKAKAAVFDKLNLTIQRGEQVALVGASGGGKSTLLYVLAGMLRLSAGDYRFNGQSVQALPDVALDAWRASGVGFVYQQAALLPHLSLLDNVLLPVAHERSQGAHWRIRATGLLSSLGLSELAGRLPAAVSGGQAQRAAIARALMRSPALVLADEPTSALDDEAAANVMQVLQTACGEGTTLVIATHDARLLQATTRVIPIAQLAALSSAGTAHAASAQAFAA
jgi:ABC-type lipoprotein export system ATPase subunit